MIPTIHRLEEKKLIGQCLEMSMKDSKIGELWRSFLPKRKEIANHVSNDLISLAVYKPSHFSDFDPTNKFERWAAVEVADFDNIPNGLCPFVLPDGLYAVFHYVGSSADSSIFQYIFGIWLPKSDYTLDDRPHFEVLGDNYKNNDPTSEEEIWIPIKER